MLIRMATCASMVMSLAIISACLLQSGENWISAELKKSEKYGAELNKSLDSMKRPVSPSIEEILHLLGNFSEALGAYDMDRAYGLLSICRKMSSARDFLVRDSAHHYLVSHDLDKADKEALLIGMKGAGIKFLAPDDYLWYYLLTCDNSVSLSVRAYQYGLLHSNRDYIIAEITNIIARKRDINLVPEEDLTSGQYRIAIRLSGKKTNVLVSIQGETLKIN